METAKWQIVEVIAHEVVVSAREGTIDSADIPSSNAFGRWDLMPVVLLEVRDSDGLVGLGEVSRNTTIAALQPWLARLPGMALAPMGLALGQLPQDWRSAGIHGGTLLEPHAPPPWSSPSPVWRAIEVAAMDLAAQRLGCRVVDLLGGAVRNRVPVDYWAGRQTPRDLQRTVERARALGFHGLKIKSRLGDPTLAQAQVVRDTGGADFELTIDPMFQWLSPRHVLSMVRALEKVGNIIRIEDPFPQDRSDQWRRFQGVAALPLVWHARTAAIFRTALQENCFDALNIGVGSIPEFMALAAAAEALGHDCWMGSGLELGVMQAARLHACAAARSCVMASDLQGALVREVHLTDWDWPYASGALPLPERPGLGVSLDHDRLRHYERVQATFSL